MRALTWLIAALGFRRGGETQRLGQRGENLAAKHLRKAGLRIVGRNLRNRYGEVDLLARAADGTLVIVEVKAGQVGAPHRPEVHVTVAKQRKLVALAVQLARVYGFTQSRIRFDVVAVEFAAQGKPIVRHFVNAFEAHV